MPETTTQPDFSPAPNVRAHFGLQLLGCLAVLLFLPGCFMTGRNHVGGLPAQYSVKSDQLLLLSDFKLKKSHPLVKELEHLRREVNTTLELPANETPVTVYLFEDEQTYKKYLGKKYPKLPHRRAYFVQLGDELAVYTYWGERVQEDLLHEYTHGLLHSSMENVPLWLDEGLAEYFEVDRNTHSRLHPDYTNQLTQQIATGWQPDLPRLESIKEFDKFQRADYRESWGWVHFMLHDSPETKQVLISYLRNLQNQTAEELPPLSAQLAEHSPTYIQRLEKYLAYLPNQANSQHASR